jgi:hypothetical protein
MSNARELFLRSAVVTKENSDLVGLALRKGMDPRYVFSGETVADLANIKPKGLTLPLFALVYGLENLLAYLKGREILLAPVPTGEFQAFWHQIGPRVTRQLLRNPAFLKRITTQEYDAKTLLKMLDGSRTSSRELDVEYRQLITDAEAYVRKHLITHT